MAAMTRENLLKPVSKEAVQNDYKFGQYTPLEVVLLGLLKEQYARAHVEKAAHPGDHSTQKPLPP